MSGWVSLHCDGSRRRLAGASIRTPIQTPISSSTFEEFARAVDLITGAGISVERTAEEAWPHFRGWRVNYESLAYRLADRLVAPRAPWSGDRRHLHEELMMPRRPPHRSPGTDSAYEAGDSPSA